MKLDPFNLELKKMSEEATQGTLRDLLTGIVFKTHVRVFAWDESSATSAFFSALGLLLCCDTMSQQHCWAFAFRMLDSKLPKVILFGQVSVWSSQKFKPPRSV